MVGGVVRGLAVLVSAVTVLSWKRGVVGAADVDVCWAYAGGLGVVGARVVDVLLHIRVSWSRVSVEMLVAVTDFRKRAAAVGEP